MLHGLHAYLRAIDAPETAGDLRGLLRVASRAGRRALDAEHCVVWFAGSPPHPPLYLVDGDAFLEVAEPPFAAEAAAASVTRRDGTALPGVAEVPAHVVVAPLPVSSTRGAVVLTRSEPFTADEEAAAGIVASALGMALEATVLRAAERFAAATASRSTLLERVTGLLQTSATAVEITQRIPAAVIEVLDCRSSWVYVLEGEELRGDGLPPLPSELDRLRRVPRSSDNPVSEAVRTGAPVVVSGDDIARYRDLTGVEPEQIGVTLVVPLAGREKVLGALSVGWGDRSPLEHADLELFAAVASQVAVALERAQLLDAERSSRAQLATSHEALATLARDLQRGLLPTWLPQQEGLQVAARYAPALAGSEIGGDWYDAVQTGHDIALIIGDVQGHSTRAAGLMGQVRTAVRAYVSEGHDPSTVLRRTNRLLVELGAELFATCCLARLDTSTGLLSVATAGHPPPLVVDESGYREIDVDPGPPLGVLAGAEYPVTRYRLLGRSALVMHTDGVVEVLGEGSEVGEATLRDTLRTTLREEPDQTAERLASTIMAAIPHALTDDAAMLVATFTGTHSGRLDASLWLPPDIRAVASARGFLRDRLLAWSTDELLDEAELVLSELVTNALVHTGGGAGLSLRFDGAERRLTISVHDSSPRHPRERTAAPDALGGRGLGIVEAVADAWGVHVDDDGKTVWAELAVEAD